MKKINSWVPVVLSLIVTPIALMLGLFSAGAGHGDYVLATILFPYTLLSTAVTGVITNLFMAVAFAQFPIYGVALAIANSTGRLRSAAIILAVIHALAVVAGFLFASESFSG